MNDADQRHITDALAAVTQADSLLTYLAEHLEADPDTSRLGFALEGVSIILDKAKAELGPLAG